MCLKYVALNEVFCTDGALGTNFAVFVSLGQYLQKGTVPCMEFVQIDLMEKS